MSLKLIDDKPLSLFILHMYKREKWLQVVSDVEGEKNENLASTQTLLSKRAILSVGLILDII